jgi:hypothetical protein
MEPGTLALANLRSSIPYSTKFLRDHTHIQTQELPKFFVQLSKRSSKPASDWLQKDPRKDLSRILRTDAAVKGIVRKANSRKYKQLWPKAVLEALDEAIRENQWENALKVSGFLFFFGKSCKFFSCFFFGHMLGGFSWLFWWVCVWFGFWVC